jgi:hypothetical protein
MSPRIVSYLLFAVFEAGCFWDLSRVCTEQSRGRKHFDH